MIGRFDAMRGMMQQMGRGGLGGMLGKVPGLGKLLGDGGMPGLEGLDPSALGDAFGAPNRRAARAMKAQDRRKQRKQQRKHKRRGKRRR